MRVIECDRCGSLIKDGLFTVLRTTDRDNEIDLCKDCLYDFVDFMMTMPHGCAFMASKQRTMVRKAGIETEV